MKYEIYRVLKKEGTFTIVLYAKWSVTFLYILLKFGLLKLELLHKSIDKLISDHMENAGYTPLAKLYSKKYPSLARILSPLQRVLDSFHN